MISKFCREWPVLLDEHGHGRCACAQAAPLLRGHVIALPRGVARLTHGIAVADSQILVIVRGRGPLVAVTLMIGWAERFQDGGFADRMLKMASTAIAGLGSRAARDASCEWSSRRTSWKNDSAMLASLASGASSDKALPKIPGLGAVTESAP